MELKTQKLANVFIETSLPEQRKWKKKKMFDELSNGKISFYDSLKLNKIQVFRIIFDKLFMAIENRFKKNENNIF